MPACDNILPVTGRFSTAHFIMIGKRLLQYVFNTIRMDSVAVLPMPTLDNINLCVQCACVISFPFSLLPSATSQAKNVHNLVLPKTKISVSQIFRYIFLLLHSICHAERSGQLPRQSGQPVEGTPPTKQLLLQVRWLWPGLTSLLRKGGAQLKDMLRSLDASATQALQLCRRSLSCRGGPRADSDRLSHSFPTYPTACCLCLCGCSSPAQRGPLRDAGGGNQEGRVLERWGESPHP